MVFFTKNFLRYLLIKIRTRVVEFGRVVGIVRAVRTVEKRSPWIWVILYGG